MTIIEFYDRTPIENVISALINVPDKIIFIGNNEAKHKLNRIYRPLLEQHVPDAQIVYKYIGNNDIKSIVDVLSEIITTEEQCVFDLTGGDDVVLVAMGIVCQRHADKDIKMQRVNIRQGKVTTYDKDGNVLPDEPCGQETRIYAPKISVQECIKLHGGVIREETYDHEGTYEWDLTEDGFVDDIHAMWTVCRQNPGKWNVQLKVFEQFDSVNTASSPLDVSVAIPALQAQMETVDRKYLPVQGLLGQLAAKKLIYNYTFDNQIISFTYKSEQVKRCLSKGGTVLELKVFSLAKSLQNEDGGAEDPYYTDALSGVFIDWDGVLHNDNDLTKDTENEIDVILMKGITPIFISCKNGWVEEEELYKLETVANRYGGIYAKKVLIATDINKKDEKRNRSIRNFRQRARDMDVTLKENVKEWTDETFRKELKSLIGPSN